ncbi:PD-(D/E)XK nuclease family protein [Spirosoma panaciterrae]|uniref:PD-(D/E)XK nuclease family protein n=1 Tax=Spirosoma panaciterrae TaxID=496058 RepID=UPI0003728CAA|nr:PD-(D/E)XK nuclease family protein [Spirosoma panaciterrae]
MSHQTQPNLFSYATSELSQDAFICWLAAWADPIFGGFELHQIAREFLLSLIHKHKTNYTLEKIQTVTVLRQVEKLDILIEINKDNSYEKLAILIEDKTHTDHHSGQLGRYYDNAKKDYTVEQIIPIYFKTGYQSKFDVGQYKTYLRKEFLELLQVGKSTIKNAIYCDFLSHLENMEYAVNQYSNTSLSDWSDNDWRGFFMQIYNSREQFYTIGEDDRANWNYVANPAGGFFGFWWYFKPLQNELYTPYLQLENNSLCFKIEVNDETKRSMAREKAFQKLMAAAIQLNSIRVERPKRMGNGRYMTVMRWDGDYRQKRNGLLDFQETLENLKKAQEVLDKTFPQ